MKFTVFRTGTFLSETGVPTARFAAATTHRGRHIGIVYDAPLTHLISITENVLMDEIRRLLEERIRIVDEIDNTPPSPSWPKALES